MGMMMKRKGDASNGGDGGDGGEGDKNARGAGDADDAVLCLPCGCESGSFFFNQLRLGASYLSPLYLGFHTVNWECLPGKSASSTVNLRTSGGRREV